MEKVKCRDCKRELVLDEQNLCVYCELTQEKTVEIAVTISCGICKESVEEDNEGLFCYVCNSWFHNNCNETPLNYELYTLLNDAPSNVKWFCDKCTWETEKWIKGVESRQCQASRQVVGKSEKIVYKLKNDETNDEEYELLDAKDIEVLHLEAQDDEEACREIKKEVDYQENKEMHKKHKKNMLEEDNKDYIPVILVNENEELKNEDSDAWELSKEEVRTDKRKKKWKINSKETKGTITENLAAENILSILDISPERLPSITDGIIYVKSSNYKHLRSKCNLCPKHFKHPEVCIAHKLVVHEGVQTPYKCSIS